jgi:tetratricopeptide (TPR) repeat protein
LRRIVRRITLASDLQSRLAEQIARLDPATASKRRTIYDEARATLNADIRAGAPFVSVQEAVRRRRDLETAIIAIERDAARTDPPPEPKKFERKAPPEPVSEPDPVPAVEATVEVKALEPTTDESLAPDEPSVEPLPVRSAHSRVSTNPEPGARLSGGERYAVALAAEKARRTAALPEVVAEQIDLGEDMPAYVPHRSVVRSLTLYAAVAVLVIGIVVAAAVIAGLGLDEIRGAVFAEKKAPLPELRLRTGPAGMSPSVNPAAEMFKTAGFNTAAAGAIKEGNALLARGEIDRAIAAFDDAIRLDPRDPGAYGNRAFAHWRKGALERAVGDYSEAIALDPANPSIRLNRAIAYNRLGEYERAVADLDRVISASPDNIEALNSRCWARAILKHLEEALADCNEAVRLKPNDTNVLDSRGFVYLRLGRLDRAIADYNAALKIDPKLAGSIYGRGLARIGRGDRAGGAEDVTTARALDPGIQDTFARYGIR